MMFVEQFLWHLKTYMLDKISKQDIFRILCCDFSYVWAPFVFSCICAFTQGFVGYSYIWLFWILDNYRLQGGHNSRESLQCNLGGPHQVQPCKVCFYSVPKDAVDYFVKTCPKVIILSSLYYVHCLLS